MQKTITREQVGKWSTSLVTNIGPCPTQRELLHYLLDVIDERDGVVRVPFVPTEPVSDAPAGAGARSVQLKPGHPALQLCGGPLEAFRTAYGLSTDETAALNMVAEVQPDGSTWVFEKKE